MIKNTDEHPSGEVAYGKGPGASAPSLGSPLQHLFVFNSLEDLKLLNFGIFVEVSSHSMINS